MVADGTALCGHERPHLCQVLPVGQVSIVVAIYCRYRRHHMNTNIIIIVIIIIIIIIIVVISCQQCDCCTDVVCSTRQDIFPKSFCTRFSHFQSNARAHSWDDTKKIMEASFGLS